MLSDVRSYYGFVKEFGQAGYFETGQSQQIVKELGYEIRGGKHVTLSGVVGGMTTMLRCIQETLAHDKDILVSKSLSVDKGQFTLPVFINALFYDLATEKDFEIPTQPEKRERVLRDLIRKRPEADCLVHRRRPRPPCVGSIPSNDSASRGTGPVMACRVRAQCDQS